MRQFPGHDKEELQNVLEENSFCLEDAIAAMGIFSSSEKKVNSNHQRKKTFDLDEVVNCVVIDDSDASENNSVVSVDSSSKSKGKWHVQLTFYNCMPM